ncbi:MAG: endonuclease/exonuclease/phosphatase family protein, partial [Sphingobium sp.]
MLAASLTLTGQIAHGGRIGPWAASLTLIWGGVAVAMALILLVACRVRPGVATAALVGVAVACYPLAREWGEGPRLSPAPSGALRLRVVSANLFHGNDDPDGMVRALLASGADIMLLQEAGGNARNAVERLHGRYPYMTYCRPGCDLRIVSRFSLLPGERNSAFKTLRKFGVSALTTRIRMRDGQVVRLVNAHFPRPFPAEVQNQFRFGLIATVAGLHEGRVIFGGDMNSTPWLPTMRRQDELLSPMRRWTRFLPSYPGRITIGGSHVAVPMQILP